MSLSPELRQRIFEEERFRVEARERAREEIRLRQQNVSLILRLLLMVALFGAAYVISHEYLNHFLNRAQAVPETRAAAPSPAESLMTQAVLDDVEGALAPKVDAKVCVRAVGRSQPQLKATIELMQDVSRYTARRIALDKARDVGAALRRHGLAVPAYVEIVAPGRWYGMAVYDRDTLRIAWDPCPGQCAREGTKYVQRCTTAAAPPGPP